MASKRPHQRGLFVRFQESYEARPTETPSLHLVPPIKYNYVLMITVALFHCFYAYIAVLNSRRS